MPIESADDLATFFDPAGFGEMLVFEDGGRLAVIWDRPTAEIELPGAGRAVVDSNVIHLPTSSTIEFDGTIQLFTPATGQRFSVEATEENWTIVGEPQRDRTGLIWICEVESS